MKRRVEVEISGHDWEMYNPKWETSMDEPFRTPEIDEAWLAWTSVPGAKVYVEWEVPDVG